MRQPNNSSLLKSPLEQLEQRDSPSALSKLKTRVPAVRRKRLLTAGTLILKAVKALGA